MQGYNGWAYKPYKPFLFDAGDIYICRIVPEETSIQFEWLGNEQEYRVYIKERTEAEFCRCGTVTGNSYIFENLKRETDYEFFVEAEEKKSRIRLARTGKIVGTVVNYLHPADKAYSFSGNYLCSPSLVKYPDGCMLASMDVYANEAPQNLTLIFRSDDDGKSWYYVSELMPCFWGKLFLHKDELYMLAVSTEYGDLLIGKSTDKGKTFTAPTVLLRGSCNSRYSGIHKNPQNIVKYKGRIYETLEWGNWHADYKHAAMVMSCDENADLLDAKNWNFTEPLKYDSQWNGVAKGITNATLEGTLCVSPNGDLLNVMRYQTTKESQPSYGMALCYKVNTENPDAPLEYSHSIRFPGNLSKFMIKYDEISGKYYSIANVIESEENLGARNLLTLIQSKDMKQWETVTNILDYRSYDPQKVGFQYVDFYFDGNDIIFLCRTAMNQADNFHNSNYSTFHRIENFRKNNY